MSPFSCSRKKLRRCSEKDGLTIAQQESEQASLAFLPNARHTVQCQGENRRVKEEDGAPDQGKVCV